MALLLPNQPQGFKGWVSFDAKFHTINDCSLKLHCALVPLIPGSSLNGQSFGKAKIFEHTYPGTKGENRS
jgi:hypothetical protein